MKKVLLMTLIALMVGAFVSGGPVLASENKPVELKIWCAWIPDTFSAKPFLHIFMDKVNKKGKAANLSIKLIGGPEVFKHRDGIEPLRNGVIDAAYTAAVYHAHGGAQIGRIRHDGQIQPKKGRHPFPVQAVNATLF